MTSSLDLPDDWQVKAICTKGDYSERYAKELIEKHGYEKAWVMTKKFEGADYDGDECCTYTPHSFSGESESKTFSAAFGIMTHRKKNVGRADTAEYKEKESMCDAFLIMEQMRVGYEKAREMLKKHNGDIVEAILEISEEQEQHNKDKQTLLEKSKLISNGTIVYHDNDSIMFLPDPNGATTMDGAAKTLMENYPKSLDPKPKGATLGFVHSSFSCGLSR